MKFPDVYKRQAWILTVACICSALKQTCFKYRRDSHIVRMDLSDPVHCVSLFNPNGKEK